MQQLSEESPSWLEKESLDTLANVSSRLAVHSTALHLSAEPLKISLKKKEFPALLNHISYHQRPFACALEFFSMFKEHFKP